VKDIDYEGLEGDEIQTWEESTVSKIYPKLRGNLFHRTNIWGYRGIKKSGNILPNQGQFHFSYPQSKTYFAFSQGYIFLFDFESVRDRDCISVHDTWGQFFFDHKPITILFRLNLECLSHKLIGNSSGPESSDPDYRSYIPYIEAWYPEPIPFAAIDGFATVAYRGLNEDPLFFEFTKNEIGLFEKEINEIEHAWSDILDKLEIHDIE